jgi:hypothetical protein
MAVPATLVGRVKSSKVMAEPYQVIFANIYDNDFRTMDYLPAQGRVN